jgi:very-short-patch-repair endonuclease
MVKKEPSEGAYRRARIPRREMTKAEKRLWQMLRLRQTEEYRFRRQAPIGRFIADFVCHAARLIVEIDGGQHDLSSEEEASRTRFLESEGCTASCGSGTTRFWTILKACSR